MTKIKLISNIHALNECVCAVKKSRWVGVDTEFLRETTYYPLLCLIQMRTESEEFCIDVLAIEDLSPLHEVFTDKNMIKIIHSCRQDLEVLDQRLDQTNSNQTNSNQTNSNQVICNLYDTQIAAAFCGYGDQVSYAALVESICQVQLDKSLTRADWSARPLSPAQLQYAIDDVNYLNPLYEFLDNQLSKLGYQTWHRDECERVLNLKSYQIKPEDAWTRLKGGSKIPIGYQQSAKALSTWREYKAQKRNRPREWILSSRALIDISIRQPKNLAMLSEIESVNTGLVKHSGVAILDVLKFNSYTNKYDCPVWKKGVWLDKEQKKRVKAVMNKLKSVAERATISESILANRYDIEALIAGKTNILLLQGWRYEFIGKQILAEFV